MASVSRTHQAIATTQRKRLKAFPVLPRAVTLVTKFHRLEAPGLNAIIDGLSKVLRDDRKLLPQTSIVFDGLCTAEQATGEKSFTKTGNSRGSQKK